MSQSRKTHTHLHSAYPVCIPVCCSCSSCSSRISLLQLSTYFSPLSLNPDSSHQQGRHPYLFSTVLLPFTSTCLCLFSVCFLSASTGGSCLKPFSSSSPLLHNSLYSSFTSPSPFPPNFLSSIYICAPFFVTLLHICGETALLFFLLSSFHINQ